VGSGFGVECYFIDCCVGVDGVIGGDDVVVVGVDELGVY